MKTQADQLHLYRTRITGIAIAMSRAAVITVLLAWAPSSIGSANHDFSPAGLPAVPAQAAGTKAVPAEPGYRPGDFPAGPLCAKLVGITATRFIEGTGAVDAVGCGIGNNLAGGTPARFHDEDRVDVATFLAWHVEGRNLAQDTYQTNPSQTGAQDHRASALTVARPFWITIAR